jgi:hypothetical protein
MKSRSAPVACTCQASRIFAQLVGLVGLLLSGCATTMPDAGSQLATLGRPPLQNRALGRDPGDARAPREGHRPAA